MEGIVDTGEPDRDLPLMLWTMLAKDMTTAGHTGVWPYTTFASIGANAIRIFAVT